MDHLQHWVLLFQPGCANTLTISLQEMQTLLEHSGKSQLDLHPCRHSAEEGQQKQVWELSWQAEPYWPCKSTEGEAGGGTHSLIALGLCSSADRNEEWAPRSEKGAPGLPPWAAEPGISCWGHGGWGQDADEGQSPCLAHINPDWLLVWKAE